VPRTSHGPGPSKIPKTTHYLVAKKTHKKEKKKHFGNLKTLALSGANKREGIPTTETTGFDPKRVGRSLGKGTLLRKKVRGSTPF